jgi:hypothetical protein
MSVQQTKWTERKFEFTCTIGSFACILERFRGTPVRLEELLRDYSSDRLVTRYHGGWSMQEHAGHLLDLEELGERRLVEFLNSQPVLSAADMGNKKTFEANHNAQPVDRILRDFRKARLELSAKLEALNETEVAVSSLHPRLNRQMRLIDWVWFMAEHDDHHLARIRTLGGIDKPGQG